ncbi:MAG: AmmeMemoRadiSam system radical SAM enzyme [Planctomycetes bacterium]|nr:AmmeMemoRadiSam system radical SAM enzyme [Planctomycetota bacterium]
MSGQPHEAMLWEPAENSKVQCRLCGHECLIAPGKLGVCCARRNDSGRLVALNYDDVIAVHVDPIEKKPLFHFLPGSRSLSFAAEGCNFQCAFCQNWQISQTPRTGEGLTGQAVPPRELVQAAKDHRCASISCTYTEPTIFFELAYDVCKLAKENGLKTCFVSNGYMTPQAVRTIRPYLDAANVDLKAFSDQTYRSVMKARLAPVLACLECLIAQGVWVEITTLIVPGMNDSPDELRQAAEFIARKLGPHVPWHLSRFHGDYQMADTPPTPIATLSMAEKIGRQAGLLYVYCGNVPGRTDERTYCPGCHGVVVDRAGFSVRKVNLDKGACPSCGQKIHGVWE